MEDKKTQSTADSVKEAVKEDKKVLTNSKPNEDGKKQGFMKNGKISNFNKDASKSQQKKPVRISTTGYEEKVVGVKRISKTTKGGRSMRFSALVVIGDKKGLVGFGMGKSIEVPIAIKKALKNAKNNMFKIKMNKRNTLYHEVIGRHGAGRVLVKPAPEGTGIIAGGPIKVVLELAGFTDVYSKNLGKNTSLNMVRATIKGLLSQKTPKEIAALRDKKLSEL
ncbi:30S ribosomal protein S5 [Malacoplasma muris]|uniref:30S ribosomal protein S5 n=1 Tax=Malacoplasma muris TaxID=2119 RepID=UPI00398EBEDF